MLTLQRTRPIIYVGNKQEIIPIFASQPNMAEY